MHQISLRLLTACLCVLLPSFSVALEIAGPAEGIEENIGIIAGQVMKNEKIPLADGTVFLFDDSLGPPPSREKYWRVPDIIGELDNQGKFKFGIPEGNYYLIAVEKIAVNDFRPPEVDTLFYYHADPKGNPKVVTVTKSMLTDIGIISTAFPFTRAMVRYDKDITAVEGKVVDLSGAPVEGALVMAFPVPASNPRPLFVSERTNKDGKFILRTHDGGKYNLSVRGIYGGGPPDSGELVGSDGPAETVQVTLKRGEKLKGMVLYAKKFPKRGPGYIVK